MMELNYENGHFLEIEPGLDLYYEDHGRGEPLLFIPGITMTTRVFERQVAHFAGKYRVITMDPRSQGRSGKVVFGNTYAQHGRDLARLIDHLGLRELTLIGWSTGNLDVWSYVDQFGTDLLKGAITIDMPPKPLSDAPADWVEFSMADMTQIMTELLTSSAGQRDFFADLTRQVMLENPTDEEVNRIVEMSLNTPYYIFHTLYTNAVLGDWREAAKTLDDRVPPLMFLAKHWSGVAEPYMNKYFPKTKTVVLGGHMMFWDHADEFNRVVDEFLAGK
jgi:Predicted hydrolases or acyltransferases (alpha/beta hydrolase superfamily)